MRAMLSFYNPVMIHSVNACWSQENVPVDGKVLWFESEMSLSGWGEILQVLFKTGLCGHFKLPAI